MQSTGAEQLRGLLDRDDAILISPGVYDGLSARVAEESGFEALYASGGAIARSLGLPDLGLLSMVEVSDRVARVCAAVAVPVIADADTGYGNALNVYRTVGEFTRAGVAAIQLEDQVTPKKCGHYSGKEIVTSNAMVRKIEAAIDARGKSGPMLIARTDAIATEGLSGAIARAERYAEAGAEILFVEAPTSREQLATVARALEGHVLLVNMFEGGRTPVVSPDDLADMGYKIVIVPSDLQRAAMRAMQEAAAELRGRGSTAAVSDRLATFDEREALVNKATWDARELRYAE